MFRKNKKFFIIGAIVVIAICIIFGLIKCDNKFNMNNNNTTTISSNINNELNNIKNNSDNTTIQSSTSNNNTNTA